MAAITLDRVLTNAESLPADEQVMLKAVLRQRRIEAWRSETVAEARKAAKDFRAGKPGRRRLNPPSPFPASRLSRPEPIGPKQPFDQHRQPRP